ncbi:MAG: CBS domain-containing protein [Pirellulaceae bacterium]|jgi:CBS domain-containing protein|nr:CBS domain-containing protein [Pirellulaceae bacterium]MDP6555799.1 CBS domain-containing protein [Pirellulaceae bacterium]
MQLRQILKTKGSEVLTIEPTASLADVVQKLVENRCGSLVVCNGETMVGIISERDILIAVAEVNEPLVEITVQRRMTSDVITGSPDDTVSNIMGLMSEKRIRHLPILDNKNLAGMISIGDIVKAQYQQLTMENHYLKNYIQS